MSTQPATPALLHNYVAAELSQVGVAHLITYFIYTKQYIFGESGS